MFQKKKRKEVRAHQKENNTPDNCKATKSGEKKGKPGKSINMLDMQIKENEQALMKLLEQARKCVKTSESSNDSNVELPTDMYGKRKERLSTRKKVRKTINKVCSKLERECNRCEARSKRKSSGGGKSASKTEKKRHYVEAEEG